MCPVLLQHLFKEHHHCSFATMIVVFATMIVVFVCTHVHVNVRLCL